MYVLNFSGGVQFYQTWRDARPFVRIPSNSLAVYWVGATKDLSTYYH